MRQSHLEYLLVSIYPPLALGFSLVGKADHWRFPSATPFPFLCRQTGAAKKSLNEDEVVTRPVR